MDKDNYKELGGRQDEVHLWNEQDSSIMLKAITSSGDPVELSTDAARNLARLLNEAADNIDN